MSKANVRNDTDILCITSHEKDLVHERSRNLRRKKSEIDQRLVTLIHNQNTITILSPSPNQEV